MKTLLGLSTAALMLISQASAAAIVTYSDRTSWAAATGALTTSEDFNGFLADTDFDSTPTTLPSGLTFSAATGVWTVDAPPLVNEFECGVDGSAFLCGGNWNELTISYAAGMRAFGADFSSLNDNNLRTRFALYNGAVLVDTITAPIVAGQLDQFFGFAATAGEVITSIVTVDLIGDRFGIDNIEVRAGNAANAVPVPATFALLGIGLLLGAQRLRK